MRVYLQCHGVPREATAEGRYQGGWIRRCPRRGGSSGIRRHFAAVCRYSSPRQAVESAALRFGKRKQFRCRSCGKWISAAEGRTWQELWTTQPVGACGQRLPGRPFWRGKRFSAPGRHAVAALRDYKAARQTDTVVVARGGTPMAALSVLACHPCAAYFDWRVVTRRRFCTRWQHMGRKPTLKSISEVNITKW